MDNANIILVNVYAPNDANQQVVFPRGLSKNLLSKYDNENLVLGDDFNNQRCRQKRWQTC